ncbi:MULTISPECIES: transcriptional regulator CynR [Pseudomonas]|uniref:Cyn operon transcriptional activator, LysR-family n=1 Tax=Pseudomonas fluorescens (strain Pf0-1) TaxID=205922 RepID=Q3KAU8_PSEPF|nr:MULTISPECIES: transcriptional regulator CynR [Pseudomonas]ABA75106.1 cyn operon transcriptional activator, LysR-family [Pseudomonas fluorescens Pf0-1]MBL0797382.1 transcriptional regulator CynR [Pseudomonas sp. B7]MBY9024675.1 transcriptional regulator CynR [Pseudomonas fluorescens]MBY9030810.1 transcriptional regulator CynR [Pseudomonas fluorescens]MBY9036813.1 transcriptional regulator CynR [Pseudomonas fluorescens]
MLLRHLRYLLAVADHGGFTRAAEALHVSQPTLSQQIRQLEESLGVDLFDRTSRSVKPTDAGQAYIECARRVLVELEAGKRALHDVKDLSRGSLRLAMTPTFMAYLVGPLVRDYVARYPGIHLEIFELSMDDIEAGLADDSLDIAIAFTPVRNPDIECIPAFVETLGVMVGREHPLYDSSSVLTPDDIAQLDFALLAPDFITRLSIDEYFRQRGITPKVQIEVNSVSTLLEVIRHAPIATMLPEAIATEDRALRRLHVESEAPQRGAALLRRQNNYHSAAAEAFMKLVLETRS